MPILLINLKKRRAPSSCRMGPEAYIHTYVVSANPCNVAEKGRQIAAGNCTISLLLFKLVFGKRVMQKLILVA